MCMRRTTRVLDEQLLEQATRVLGAKAYSAAVNTAVGEVIRLKKIQAIPQFFGTGIWRAALAGVSHDGAVETGYPLQDE